MLLFHYWKKIKLKYKLRNHVEIDLIFPKKSEKDYEMNKKCFYLLDNIGCTAFQTLPPIHYLCRLLLSTLTMLDMGTSGKSRNNNNNNNDKKNSHKNNIFLLCARSRWFYNVITFSLRPYLCHHMKNK